MKVFAALLLIAVTATAQAQTVDSLLDTADGSHRLGTVKPANASSEMYLSATLAPAASFEFDLAPSFTKVDVILHGAAAKLRKHEITKAHAKVILGKAEEAHVLLKGALDACGEDASGQCDKDPVAARMLLAHAKSIIASIK
jgi:hypothetical protein